MHDCLDKEAYRRPGEKQHEAAEEIRGRQLPEPPGEEEAVAEGRGADVEAEHLAAHPKVDALRGGEAALLEGDPGGPYVGDLPAPDGLLDCGVALLGRCLESFNQGGPMAERLAEHGCHGGAPSA